ncbi:site-specific integrase [Salinifilum aidingensis]
MSLDFQRSEPFDAINLAEQLHLLFAGATGDDTRDIDTEQEIPEDTEDGDVLLDLADLEHIEVDDGDDGGEGGAAAQAGASGPPHPCPGIGSFAWLQVRGSGRAVDLGRGGRDHRRRPITDNARHLPGRLRTIVLPAMAELRLREVTVYRVEQVCQTVRTNWSVDSTRTVRNIISGICALAVRYRALELNPVRHMSSLEGKKKVSRSLTAEEMKDLLHKLDSSDFAAKHDLPDLVRWYAGTGYRTGEALAVHWHHLDLDGGTAQWPGNVIRAKGTGLIINEGKTEVSERILALPSWLVTMLRRRRERLADELGALPERVAGPVFPNTAGGLRDKANTLARWRDFRATAGYPWVTFRTFRRSVATVLDEAGLSAREIADQLGHSKVSTTQDVRTGRRVRSHRAAEALSRVECFEG